MHFNIILMLEIVLGKQFCTADGLEARELFVLQEVKWKGLV